MTLTPKALDLIEKGTLYQGEFSTACNYKGIFLEVQGKVDILYIFKSDEFGQIDTKKVMVEYDLANCFPTTEDHLLKMMRAKFGLETKRRARASFAAMHDTTICTDQRKHYITQYSVK